MLIASIDPARWAPVVVAPGASTRASGLLRAGIDAWRGVPERAVGVRLTEMQVDALAPFLASQAGVDALRVREALTKVQVHIGGPAAGAGNMATTFGTHLYVSDAARATRLLSWGGRRWLAHELVHTVQWLRGGTAADTDARRDRVFLERYVGSYGMSGGSVRAGGAWQAAAELIRRLAARQPVGSIGNLIHDTHPMEREASRIADAFVRATASGRSDPG